MLGVNSHEFLVQELPGLLVEDPLGDVYKTPTREEVSRKYHKVVKVIHANANNH